MKGTWKCFTTGLTTFASQSVNIFSLSGAMETAVREYSSQKTAKYNNRYRQELETKKIGSYWQLLELAGGVSHFAYAL